MNNESTPPIMSPEEELRWAKELMREALAEYQLHGTIRLGIRVDMALISGYREPLLTEECGDL